jgi:hypothetical protein
MFARTPKSPAAGPTLDLVHCAGVGDSSRLRTQHLQEWRRAAQRVVRTYKEWCAVNWRDRHHLYLSFLDALGREEQAARRLELDAGVLGAPKGDQS